MVSLILMLLFCLFIAIFSLQNSGAIQLQFLWWKSQTLSPAVLVILSAAAGALLAFFLSIPSQHRRRKQLKEKERELQDIRNTLGSH